MVIDSSCDDDEEEEKRREAEGRSSSRFGFFLSESFQNGEDGKTVAFG
jgi:hypothetical protein